MPFAKGRVFADATRSIEEDHPNRKKEFEMKTPILTQSDLSRIVIKDGSLGKVNIFADGDGGWTLHVESYQSGGNHWIWREPFPTEESALAEGLECVESEGLLEGYPPRPLRPTITRSRGTRIQVQPASKRV
jgi:hypothetical protein